MSNSEPPASLDFDKSHFKMGIRTQISLIGAVIAITTWVATTYAGIATKDGVVAVVKERAEAPLNSALSRVGGLEASDKQQNIDIATIKENVGEIKGIRAKIDFLTQQAIIEAQESRAGRSRVVRAARQVRAAAQQRGQPDPLADVAGIPASSEVVHPQE